MGVKGSLQDMSLTGLISINCNEGNQARLRLEHAGQEALIYFDGGQIAHMVMGDREGEEVIRDLLNWLDGAFELDMDVPPPARTVDTPWSTLVLDGMRVLDEEGLAGGGEGGEAWDGEAGLFAEEASFVAEQSHTQEVDKMANLRDLLREMSGEIQGFQAAAVSGVDGLSIAEYSASPDFNLEVATAQFALVMKLVQKNAARLNSGEVEDNLVTTGDAYILSRFLGNDAQYYLVVAVDRDLASLGNVRLMTRNFAPDLWDAIPRRR